MMRQFELLERVQRYNPAADEVLLNKAYIYAMTKHGKQTRASGDPYFSHPLEVAAILTDLQMDDATVAVALLHDTIEDTDATRDEIDALFGREIGHLVDGLTKIRQLNLDSRQEVSQKAKQAENLRKLLLAISDDVRVLLVKLADRLHNMRTLDHMAPEKRVRIGQETLDIYAPLAGRMGMQDMREELEDLAFFHSNPEAHNAVSQKLTKLLEQSETAKQKIEEELHQRLQKAGISATVTSRHKKPYSVFKKMERKSISFEQLPDILGFRIITEDEPSCYAVLGIIHTTWPQVPGRFKDYISVPKQNDYRSIHTTVVGPARERVELQIRSAEMQQIAEYGIAAHSLYKDAAVAKDQIGEVAAESNAYAWLRKTIESLSTGGTAEEFLENTKLELFHDQVFCFTPKGRLIALPTGATPLDFAYAVHTDVGNTCVGCKVNGRIIGLASTLKNGDEVEIMTSAGQTPPIAWEKIAVTGRARSAIRRANRALERERFISLGRQMLDWGFRAVDHPYDAELVDKAVSILKHANREELMEALGEGDLGVDTAMKTIFPDFQKSRAMVKPLPESEGWFSLASNRSMRFRFPNEPISNEPGERLDHNMMNIKQLAGNSTVRFAPGGGAVPGDRIVGIVTAGEGITVYPIHSESLMRFDEEPDRWLDVQWDVDPASNERFPANLFVSMINEPGSLASIANIIAQTDGNIDNIKMTKRADDFTEMAIDLEVWDLKHLMRIINEVRALKIVSHVDRISE
ncbi:MAG: bifunctional (p)ppGpp synthetase/guanosine-3',5'-bis(diphosphate) 3'-pyrophosphohydrolase [Alphaproteobacteria bacterium]|nr:bifunctional (p)ppGpp synthetase/guanosine-3',5'-bis(diphosphate) 3'-pyrophosphohydrolase [Alphaproteobacteria bacterium]